MSKSCSPTVNQPRKANLNSSILTKFCGDGSKMARFSYRNAKLHFWTSQASSINNLFDVGQPGLLLAYNNSGCLKTVKHHKNLEFLNIKERHTEKKL